MIVGVGTYRDDGHGAGWRGNRAHFSPDRR